MKISFLVTYYNQKQYVAQSLESILAIHKPCEWEILVGDDGSSDGTQDAVLEYVQKYPNNIAMHIMPRDPSVKYAPVQRASANRINLLEKATGDFYCILDGDDYYCDADFVEEAIHICQENNKIAAVMYGFKHVIDGVDGQYYTLPAQYHEKIIDKGTYLDSLYTHAGACVFRKKTDTVRMALLKGTGYWDDNDIVIYNMFFGELYCVNRVVYAYRQSGCSVYTSMNHLEQVVLNVQGYDVDRKLIDIQYADNLLRRNAGNLVVMYVWRKYLWEVMGEEKCERYLNSCATIKQSLCADLLSYERLPGQKKKEIWKIIRQAMMMRKKQTLREYIKLAIYKMKG